MRIANSEAKKAFDRGDYPAGCVIVKNGKILSKASSTKISSKNPLGHAELNAIVKACKKLNSGFLDGCTVYVNVEPCLMCANAMVRTRVKKVVYGAENNEHKHTSFHILKQNGIAKPIIVKAGLQRDTASELLKRFLKSKK